jgi:hypothetical protein
MNGPRLLSNDRLSYAVISSTSSSSAPDHIDYSLFLCATHFIGDGAALNQSAHDLLCILTSTQSDEELKKELDKLPDWVSNRNLVHRTRLILSLAKHIAAGLRNSIAHAQLCDWKSGGQD